MNAVTSHTHADVIKVHAVTSPQPCAFLSTVILNALVVYTRIRLCLVFDYCCNQTCHRRINEYKFYVLHVSKAELQAGLKSLGVIVSCRYTSAATSSVKMQPLCQHTSKADAHAKSSATGSAYIDITLRKLTPRP